jgi:hypothetical protein
MDSHEAEPEASPCFWHYDHDALRRATTAVEELKSAVGIVNPRPPGLQNDAAQYIKRWLARVLGWYTRPAHEFNASVSRALGEIACALEHLSMNMLSLDHLSLNMGALEARLAQLEKRLAGLQTGANPESTPERMSADRSGRTHASPRSYIDTGVGNDRTAYVIGLFGSGRHYINEVMLQNIGERAKYFRDMVRLHPGPTPMIYSGHATMKYVSRAQAPPEVMNGILKAVRSGFADVIFVYRHPLDSLLTNWIWWRTYLRENLEIPGISHVYKDTDDLCGDLERNFPEFQAFADGNADLFAAMPSQRFLSFPEFVEETDLHLQSATLALRFEECMIDPRKEFSKIADVMSVDLDLSRLSVDPPRAKPYGHLAVKEKVPRFKNFINELDAETKRRIEKIGYGGAN